MKKNIGMIDKLIRVIIAIVAIALFFTDKVTGTPGIIMLVVAGVLLLTSLISFCPLYAPLGIKTCKDK